MVIYLYHEKHGTKVACSEQEAQLDCGNGWKRGMPPVEEVPIVNVLADNADELREKWEEKFGKKPHHLKSAKKLQAEIDA